MLLAAESRGRARTFQEQCPGVRALAPRLKGAQTGHLIDGHQLDGVKLARTRYAKAAHQRQVPNATCVKMTTDSLERHFDDAFEKLS